MTQCLLSPHTLIRYELSGYRKEEEQEKYQTRYSLHRQLREPIQEGPNSPNEFDTCHISIWISQAPSTISYLNTQTPGMAAIVSFPAVQHRLFQERFAMVTHSCRTADITWIVLFFFISLALRVRNLML